MVEAKDNEYNSIPVIFCSECLSLKVLSMDGIDYCDECGSTITEESSIFNWEKLYEQKYSHKYLEEK